LPGLKSTKRSKKKKRFRLLADSGLVGEIILLMLAGWAVWLAIEWLNNTSPSKIDPATNQPSQSSPSKIDPATNQPRQSSPSKIDPATNQPSLSSPSKIDRATNQPSQSFAITKQSAQSDIVSVTSISQESMKSLSSGRIGCTPDDITIIESSSSSSTYNWTAVCKEQEFVCIQDLSGLDQTVTCTARK